MKNINEIRNYFLQEIEKNELKIRKHKNVHTTLNYMEHFLVLAFTMTGCISISAFASLLVILTGIMSSAAGLKNCVISTGVKKSKSIVKKRGRNKIKQYY